MVHRTYIYEILYALLARGGREASLLGESGNAARRAFAQSLPGADFPEIWFEIPLAGDPWFDFHALASRDDPAFERGFDSDSCGGNPEAFAWFAAQGRGVRQLALSWDTSSGKAENPAVQLLVKDSNPDLACGFLRAAGRPDAAQAYRSFVGRIPQNWFACYSGVFPGRPGSKLRVECIPIEGLQDLYANDAALLEEHLARLGLADAGRSIVPRCQWLAGLPFQLEFQFDVDGDGQAAETFGASVRFGLPESDADPQPFEADGAAGNMMKQLERWGLADDRWRLLEDTFFSKRLSRGDDSALLYCYPTFVKLRWRAGEPLDAKAYLIAGAQ